MKKPARTVAPLVDLKYCDLMQDDFQVDTDLYFEAAPQIEDDQTKEDWLGGMALDELRCSGWGFRHEYDPDPHVHLGQKEENSQQLLHQALLALWITRPTGANYSWFLNYHDRLGSDAVSVQRFDSVHPITAYENAKITSTDLDELRRVWQGMRPIFSQSRLILTLNHLYAALHIDKGEPRFMMFTVVLESLFTTSRDELSHRVSERIAFFLETNNQDRANLYQKVRDIYGTRSMIAHGITMKKKDIQKMQAIHPELEFLVQRILKKIILDGNLIAKFSASQKNRDAYLNSLLFI